MPYITITACDQERQMQQMDVTVRLHAKPEFYNTPKYWKMHEQIMKEFEDVVRKYFDENFESDYHGNHEYNLMMGNK